MSPNPLERAVISTLLAGDGPTLVSLRAQFEVATVTSRELTGVGFFADFSVPADLRLPFDTLVLDGVHASLNGVANAAGFILFVTDGLIATLEGFSYGDDWPREVHSFTLSHSDPANA